MGNYSRNENMFWTDSETLSKQIYDHMVNQQWGRALKKMIVLQQRNERMDVYNRHIQWASHYCAVSDDLISSMCIEPGNDFVFGMEPPFSGIGDNIILTLIPEAAKKAGWKSVYLIENHGLSDETFDVIWGNRDDIDGISNQPKTNKDIWMWDILQSIYSVKTKLGIIQRVIMSHGLYPWSVGKWPKIGYIPKIDTRIAGKVLIDLGSNSEGSRLKDIDPSRIERLLQEKGISDYTIVVPSNPNTNWSRIPLYSDNIIESKTLKEYCDLIFSAELFLTVSNGGYWIASALRKDHYKFNRIEILDSELGYPSWMTLPIETWEC
jgi:hypothetical protein